ncbi:MAG: hypothetical protein IJP54_09395 [Synergistaceae bacterium]|nr:hypothetical protein [Synergistaceae bacterium]
MSTSFIAGFCLMGALCILCLVASMAVLIKAQELHSRSVDILVVAYDWLEQCRYKYGKETEHEETNHD